MNKYEARHIRNVEAYKREVQKIFDEATKEALRMGIRFDADTGKPFSFDDYPATKRKFEALMAKMHQRIMAVVSNGDDAEYGQHVFLTAELHAVVDLTVEVYGEVADLQQRTLDVQKQCDRFHGALATYHHSSGDGERTVKPCRHDGSAVDLGVEFHHAALRA